MQDPAWSPESNVYGSGFSRESGWVWSEAPTADVGPFHLSAPPSGYLKRLHTSPLSPVRSVHYEHRRRRRILRRRRTRRHWRALTVKVDGSRSPRYHARLGRVLPIPAGALIATTKVSTQCPTVPSDSEIVTISNQQNVKSDITPSCASHHPIWT